MAHGKNVSKYVCMSPAVFYSDEKHKASAAKIVMFSCMKVDYNYSRTSGCDHLS